MSYSRILHHGAVSGVTGSCHQLQVGVVHAVPIDSRVFQSVRASAQALAHVRKGRKSLAFANLLTVDSHQAHLAMVARLAETAQRAIVIAGGAVCSIGHIVNYLKAMLYDPRHDVLLLAIRLKGRLAMPSKPTVAGRLRGFGRKAIQNWRQDHYHSWLFSPCRPNRVAEFCNSDAPLAV